MDDEIAAISFERLYDSEFVWQTKAAGKRSEAIPTQFEKQSVKLRRKLFVKIQQLCKRSKQWLLVEV